MPASQRLLDRPRVLEGFAVLLLFTGFAGDAWRNALSWYGFGVIAVACIVIGALILVRHRTRITRADIPSALLVFLVLATTSIAWSAYPGASALGVAAQWSTTVGAASVALTLDGAALLRAFATTLRAILALSLAFELVVAFLVRAPVLPVWASAADRDDPRLLVLWSRDLLLEGGPVQGVVGSSSLLAMIALLAIIVFAVQLADRTVGRISGCLWLALAAATVLLTRSATITLGLVAAALVTVVLLIQRQSSRPRLTGGLIALALLAAAGVVVALRGTILEALGKSQDLTGRVGIWQAVIETAQQRPVFGWGWVSFWAPWVEPFQSLVTRNGVRQLHAHDAWLDVWLQLGILGLVVFGALVAIIAVRAWRLAVCGTTALTLAPALLLTAQLVQSIAESRMLVEGGWMLLVILAIQTKRATTPARPGLPHSSAAAVRAADPRRPSSR